MNISTHKPTELEMRLTISINQEDIKDKVEKVLKDYRKTAVIPGFRKGNAPMSFIKKKFETAVKIEEINKLIQSSLQDYLEKEKINYLAEPLPVEQEELDFDAESFDFQFDFGLRPEINVDLKSIKPTFYTIEADKKDITESIERMQDSFATEKEAVKVPEKFKLKISTSYNGEDKEFDVRHTLLASPKKFTGKKEGEIVKIKAQDLFNDVHQLQHFLGIDHDAAHDLKDTLEIKITDIKELVPGELNKELFDKVYPNKGIETEEDFKKTLKTELENYYNGMARNYFLNQTTDTLLQDIKVSLPKDFLIRFFQHNDSNLTDEKAQEQYTSSEEAFKYQLIEQQIVKDHKIQVEYADIISKQKANILQQFASYGIAEIPEEELEKYAVESLKERQTIEKINQEVIEDRLADLFKQETSVKNKTISGHDFMDLLEKENEKKAKK